MGKFLVLLILVSTAAWILAVVSWFTHHDHAAIGWFGLSVIMAGYANQVAQRFAKKKGTFI